jgi:hypothetical protein
MVTVVDILKQQRVDALRERFAALFARRGELAADKDAVRRLDSDLETLCRDLASAERALKE